MKNQPIHPKKRLLVGRPQKRYKNTFQLLKTIKTETTLWALLLVLGLFNVAILVLFVLKASGLSFGELLSAINNAISSTTGTSLATSLSVLTIGKLTLSPLELLIFLIAGRILFNMAISRIIKWSAHYYQDFLNHFITLINAIVSAIALFITSITMIIINVALYEGFKAVLFAHQLAFGELSTTKTKMTMVLIDLDFIAAYVMFSSIIVLIAINTVRSIIAFVNSFILLPPVRNVNKELKVSNYHSSDFEPVKEMFLQSSNANGPQLTEKNFNQLIKNFDINNFRVLLLNGVPVGFYTTGEERTILEEVIVSPEHRGKGFGEILIDDFEESARRGRTTTLTARFYAEDLKTAEYLTNKGWKDTSITGKSQKEFQKTI